MSDGEAAKIRATQAGSAEVLAALLRENEVPPIRWYVTSTDGRLEGQVYREDSEAARADLAVFAEVLGSEVREVPADDQEGGGWTQLAVQGDYRGGSVTVFGHIDMWAAE